ncbi:MAG: glycerol-3-phosphate 1-O-acyltransferase PlsY [Chthoniobacterales bacterium]
MLTAAILLVLAVSYLLGTFPSGRLAGIAAGVDISKHGSGNIGATNVLRLLGKPYGYAVFAADAFKGLVAVRFALLIMERTGILRHQIELVAILAAITCVAGHTFPVWFLFKGGKGVATSAGAIFGLMPLAAIIIFLVWVFLFNATRYVSVASVGAAAALPVTVGAMLWLKLAEGRTFLYFSIAMALLVIWRHRSNLARLRAGTEPRFDRK